MTDSKAASFAEYAMITLSSRLADDMDAHAAEIETRGIEVSGPEALRTFASFIRKTNDKMKAEAKA